MRDCGAFFPTGHGPAANGRHGRETKHGPPNDGIIATNGRNGRPTAAWTTEALSEDTSYRAELIAIQAANTALDGELTPAVTLAIGTVTDVLLQILGLHGG